jgi:hypothetical protein
MPEIPFLGHFLFWYLPFFESKLAFASARDLSLDAVFIKLESLHGGWIPDGTLEALKEIAVQKLIFDSPSYFKRHVP